MTVTIYKAAKLSRVPMGTLYSQSKMIPRAAYFRTIKANTFIDTEDPMWIAYVENYKIMKGFKSLDNEHLRYLVDAVVKVIKDFYSPSDERMEQLLIEINKQYQVNKDEQ